MPALLTSNPLAFSGANTTDSEFVVHLSLADNVETQQALQSWKDAEHGDAQSVSQSTFPLPNLGPRLREISRELHSGKGVAVLRGLELAKTPEDNMIIYLGISSYVGSQRGMSDASGIMLIFYLDDANALFVVGAQNKKRDMISHITDSKNWSKVRF